MYDDSDMSCGSIEGDWSVVGPTELDVKFEWLYSESIANDVKAVGYIVTSFIT